MIKRKNNTLIVPGIPAVLLALDLVFSGCDNGSTSGGDSGNTTLQIHNVNGLTINTPLPAPKGGAVNPIANKTRLTESDCWYLVDL